MLKVRGIRGAITVSANNREAVREATVELLQEICNKNDFELSDVVFVEFTVTSDITAATPPFFARTELGWSAIPFMCYREFEFDGSLSMCIRVMIVVNTEKSQDEINHVYLKGAKLLRKDLCK